MACNAMVHFVLTTITIFQMNPRPKNCDWSLINLIIFNLLKDFNTSNLTISINNQFRAEYVNR